MEDPEDLTSVAPLPSSPQDPLCKDGFTVTSQVSAWPSRVLGESVSSVLPRLISSGNMLSKAVWQCFINGTG